MFRARQARGTRRSIFLNKFKYRVLCEARVRKYYGADSSHLILSLPINTATIMVVKKRA